MNIPPVELFQQLFDGRIHQQELQHLERHCQLGIAICHPYTGEQLLNCGASMKILQYSADF